MNLVVPFVIVPALVVLVVGLRLWLHARIKKETQQIQYREKMVREALSQNPAPIPAPNKMPGWFFAALFWIAAVGAAAIASGVAIWLWGHLRWV